jgi:hypothetical protein
MSSALQRSSTLLHCSSACTCFDWLPCNSQLQCSTRAFPSLALLLLLLLLQAMR